MLGIAQLLMFYPGCLHAFLYFIPRRRFHNCLSMFVSYFCVVCSSWHLATRSPSARAGGFGASIQLLRIMWNLVAQFLLSKVNVIIMHSA